MQYGENVLLLKFARQNYSEYTPIIFVADVDEGVLHVIQSHNK